ncbi:MAG: nucleoside monophosphate kinase [Candidatus Curtissbacteria bacterium]|nr:nucleoside monophosphate kinase [Candidatus Curtissbacteria bacterium]
MRVIVMGPQGSGKSTQAGRVAQEIGLPHLQTGALYRQMAQGDNKFARGVRSYLEQGKLVPDDAHDEILKNEVAKPEFQMGFVLDGTPRTLSQAQNLPFKPDKVIYLAVSDEENVKRLTLRGREDDTPKVISERLCLYHQETEPVLDYYRQKGILEEVDGERPIEVITQDILGRLVR